MDNVSCNYIQCNLRTIDVCPTINITGERSRHLNAQNNNAKGSKGEVAMAGLIFTISILTILTTVGFLFAWMVRLASTPDNVENKTNSLSTSDLTPKSIHTPKL